ncbi:MAG: capsular biosynthesis protein [Cytophagales bacterium]|nr:capsular biosynthesis protein [Cytophaga sp.]
MSIFQTLFGSKPVAAPDFLKVDMHSHLLPGIDDGSKTMEESIELIRTFSELGYRKLITTPHIMGDFFKNSKENILPLLEEVRAQIKLHNIPIELEAAAEYYLDEWFIEKLEKNEPLLTFGDNYVLFETSYINESTQLHQTIFLMRSAGYIPVLAHPERYVYLYDSFDEFKKIFEMDVLFQLNLNSLSGYYSKSAKIFSEKLIDQNMVHFVGSDCHGKRHLEALKRAMNTKHFRKLQYIQILNNSL